MSSIETQNQEKKTCLSKPNGESGTANTSVTSACSVKVPVESSAHVHDHGQTKPQNAANSTDQPLLVTHAVTTSTVAISPVLASTQPITTAVNPTLSNTATKLVITTKGPRPISPLLVGSRVSSPVVTVSAQPVLARMNPSKIIAVPRATSIQQPAATIKPPQATSVQLPANFQIPPGMVLIRSDSGQLMLVSQQALAQAQGLVARSAGIGAAPITRPPATQVSTAAVVRKADNPAVIRMLPPPIPLETTAQRTIKAVGVAPTPSTSQSLTPQPVIRPVVPVTCPGPSSLIIPNKLTNTPKATTPSITPEVLENVKKCKNFLVTLIKLASSGTHSFDMAKNVRELVKSLLDGRLEPEEFTDQLYRELKSSPQPYLVPFLKKSLPVLRQLTPNPQLFIQEVYQSKASGRTPALLSTNARPAHLNTASGQPMKSTALVIQQPGGVVCKPTVTSSGPARTYVSVQNRSLAKPMVLQSGQHQNTVPLGAVVRRTPFQVPPPPAQRHLFKESVSSFREEDDINDVASMAGVNLTEENARILATNSELVGSVVQSCCDEPFLAPGPLHTCILHTGKALGMSEVGSDVVNLVSQATQERLRDLLEKVTVVARHRQLALKEDFRHVQISDVRSQLRFLEELERLEKQRRDNDEREALLRIARSRCNAEDPDQQLLKQRARELQQLEQAQLEHREANLTALAAIGPRKKRPLDSAGSQVVPGGTVPVPRVSFQRVTRVSLRDLLFCLEQDPPLRHSLVLYKALLS
ncbi:transcription initiation factor TFIID subunit 4 [Esox lucius]|uniref:TAFH domain-containing protein n=1 Tax=Esox lucius TaxID=8010 RepID=A0A3P8ZD99_ESOLU|nr:transcription initiation factor TFIID subunit 4 [Esox lucius]